VWVILDRRRARQALDRMHGAELERIAAERRSVESDLQAMQARGEPKFLFNTLAQVYDLYRVDAVRGERMLDDLIAYLRAAMPRMRDSSSTLAQEIELARAHLAIAKMRLGDRLDYSIDVPLQGDVRMPSMMLLPLVDHAITKGLQGSQASGSIRVAADIVDDQVRLVVEDTGGSFMPGSNEAAFADLRERLSALYGNGADFELRRCAADGSEAVVRLPLQRTDAR
jgi:LytS/YehU family sensor histidine kinase